MYQNLKMYFYLICIIIKIYSAVAEQPVPMSVLELLDKSFTDDPNYKCGFLRSTKLFVPDNAILKNCTNFKLGQQLKNDRSLFDYGLCILYYNNFESLCALTHNVTSFKIEEPIPNLTINEVCETLKHNTHFVSNARPGINSVTQLLQDDRMCYLLCSLKGSVETLCNLSAYMVKLFAYIQSANEKTTEKTLAEHKTLPPQNEAKKIFNTANQEVLKYEVSVQEPAHDIAVTHVDAVPEKLAETRLEIVPEKLPETHLEAVPEKLQPDTNLSKTKLPVPQKDHALKTQSLEDKNTQIDPLNAESNVAKVSPVKPISNMNEETTPPVVDTPEINPHNDNKINNANSQSIIEQPPKIPAKLESKPKPDDTKDIPPIIPKLPTELDPVGDKPKEEESYKEDKKIQDQGNDGREGETQIDEMDDDGIDIDAMAPAGELEFDNDGPPKLSEVKTKTESIKSIEKLKPLQTDEERYPMSANQNDNNGDSYFFSYFMLFCIIFICGYVAYHNKQKILALVVEGRKGRRPSRSRRPNSANYRKLDSNLEEAVTSTCNKNAPQVIY